MGRLHKEKPCFFPLAKKKCTKMPFSQKKDFLLHLSSFLFDCCGIKRGKRGALFPLSPPPLSSSLSHVHSYANATWEEKEEKPLTLFSRRILFCGFAEKKNRTVVVVFVKVRYLRPLLTPWQCSISEIIAKKAYHRWPLGPHSKGK